MRPLFSTAYLPPVAYMAALIGCGKGAIETQETFPKQTYRNRAEVLTAGGRRTLTVPVVRGNHSRTEEVAIDYSERWNTIHLRTLEAAYAASPFYLYYKDGLAAIIMRQHSRLLDLNQALMEWLLDCLKVDCPTEPTICWEPPCGQPTDFRYAFSPKQSLPDNEPYYQVFADRHPFVPNLSIVDLLFNLGPDTAAYLRRHPYAQLSNAIA